MNPTPEPPAVPPPGPVADQNLRWRKIVWTLMVAFVLVPPLWFAGRLLIGLTCLYFHWLVTERRDHSIEIDLLLLSLAGALAITGAVMWHGLKRGWYGRQMPAPAANQHDVREKMIRAVWVFAMAVPVVWWAEVLFLSYTDWWWWEHNQSGIDRYIVTTLDAAALLSVAVGVAWVDFRRSWKSRQWLSIVAGVVLVLGGGYLLDIHRTLRSSQDKAVLSNLRGLSAGADQYYLETGATIAALGDLVGPLKYTKALNTVAHETYPAYYTQGMTITVTGVAGLRTITYAP